MFMPCAVLIWKSHKVRFFHCWDLMVLARQQPLKFLKDLELVMLALFQSLALILKLAVMSLACGAIALVTGCCTAETASTEAKKQ